MFYNRQTNKSQIDAPKFRSKWENMTIEELVEEEFKVQKILAGPIPNSSIRSQYDQIQRNLSLYIQHREEQEPEGKI